MAAKRSLGRQIGSRALTAAGLSPHLIAESINHTHSILDLLDDRLVSSGADRMAEMVELANLSAIVGNLFGAAIAKHSGSRFERNGPHKYPDLVTKEKRFEGIEIKVALEANKPKGHLVKAGLHLICRYVLVNERGEYDPARRGNRVAIWEVRFGMLLAHHFNVSNTAGDSGKTAVVNAEGMLALNTAYIDLEVCPYSKRSATYKQYLDLLSSS